MRCLVSSIVVAFGLFVAGVEAQTTTGRLMGSVVDESGAALVGATVSISSPALIGGTQVGITDDRGEFLFLALAPGQYRVVSEFPGFQTQERTGVKVSLGGAAVLTLAMPVASFAGEIEVSDETPVVDPTQVSSSQVFDTAYLQQSAIGTANRSYLMVVNQTAGVAGGGSWRLPQPRVFGSTIGENAYFVDGVDTTDPVMATATSSLNFDAIDEVQLQAGGFEAEYGRATGGILNVVTKSGGNLFTGTLDARYRDESFQESGDHFDTDELDSSFEDYSATLGGPVVRDRLWFFASYERTEDLFTPVGSPATRLAAQQNMLAKLTWQIAADWRLTGRYSSEPGDEENGGASQWVMPEATSRWEDETSVASADLTAVLSDRLLWGTTLGSYRFRSEGYPMSGDLQAISHYNFSSGVTSHSYPNQQYWRSRRNDANTDLTWFLDDLAGSHELKGGLEYSDLSFTATNCLTGTPNGERCVDDGVGFQFGDITVDGEAVPYLMIEGHTAGPLDYEGDLVTGFVQDAWRVTPDLTLKLGVRYDRVIYDTNTGAEIADMDMIQPRLGLAWDITGDATDVVRGSWGRFMHPNALTLPYYLREDDSPAYWWYSCSGLLPLVLGIPVGDADECSAVAADLGWDYRRDHEGWDPYGWVLAPWERYGTETNRVDPNLQATYADELILAYERAVGDRSSIELTFVDKATRDVHEDTCNGNWPTPSADAACDYYVHANIPGMQRDYRAYILKYENRGLDWLTLLASYTYSTSEGSTEYTQDAGSVADVYPWHFDNRYGYLSDHREHRLKLNGFVNLPRDWTIAFDAFWSSPFTWTPWEDRVDNPEIPYGVHYLEPRGSREANREYQLDLQVSKGFAIGAVRMVLIGSVYNAFSNEQPTSVCWHVSGCGGIAMGEPTVWQIPRRYEVGIRLEF